MTSATLELYTALVDAGVDKEKAQKAAESVVTRADAEHFATKADINRLEVKITDTSRDLQRFLFTALTGQAIFVVGMVITLIQILS